MEPYGCYAVSDRYKWKGDIMLKEATKLRQLNERQILWRLTVPMIEYKYRWETEDFDDVEHYYVITSRAKACVEHIIGSEHMLFASNEEGKLLTSLDVVNHEGHEELLCEAGYKARG